MKKGKQKTFTSVSIKYAWVVADIYQNVCLVI